MSKAFRPPEAELYTQLFRLRADVDRLNRMPSGENSIGSRHLGVVPIVRVQISGVISIGTASATTVTWTTEVEDTDSMWDAGSPTIISFPTPGWYEFQCGAAWATSVTGNRGATIRRSDGTHLGGGRSAANPTVGEAMSICFPGAGRITAGQTVRMDVYQTSGGPLDLSPSDGGLGPRTFLYARWVCP
jgi:hypothetical protein